MRDSKYSLEIMREELGNKYISPEIKYAFNASVEALEKQVPKKVTRDSMYSPALCPSCHTDEICKSLGDGYYKYYTEIKHCPECGQKLDWD